MSNVNLNLYKIFCKVAESKSYNEASDKLDGLSVANISTQISNLEKQLNLILFNRESKGVTLTENGKELYEILILLKKWHKIKIVCCPKNRAILK